MKKTSVKKAAKKTSAKKSPKAAKKVSPKKSAKKATAKKAAKKKSPKKKGATTAATKARVQRTAAQMRDAVAAKLPPRKKATRQQKPPEVAGLTERSPREESEVQAAANEATQLNRQTTTRIAGHVSGRDRRTQARRDR